MADFVLPPRYQFREVFIEAVIIVDGNLRARVRDIRDHDEEFRERKRMIREKYRDLVIQKRIRQVRPAVQEPTAFYIPDNREPLFPVPQGVDVVRVPVPENLRRLQLIHDIGQRLQQAEMNVRIGFVRDEGRDPRLRGLAWVELMRRIVEPEFDNIVRPRLAAMLRQLGFEEANIERAVTAIRNVQRREHPPRAEDEWPIFLDEYERLAAEPVAPVVAPVVPAALGVGPAAPVVDVDEDAAAGPQAFQPPEGYRNRRSFIRAVIVADGIVRVRGREIANHQQEFEVRKGHIQIQYRELRALRNIRVNPPVVNDFYIPDNREPIYPVPEGVRVIRVPIGELGRFQLEEDIGRRMSISDFRVREQVVGNAAAFGIPRVFGVEFHNRYYAEDMDARIIPLLEEQLRQVHFEAGQINAIANAIRRVGRNPVFLGADTSQQKALLADEYLRAIGQAPAAPAAPLEEFPLPPGYDNRELFIDAVNNAYLEVQDLPAADILDFLAEATAMNERIRNNYLALLEERGLPVPADLNVDFRGVYRPDGVRFRNADNPGIRVFVVPRIAPEEPAAPVVPEDIAYDDPEIYELALERATNILERRQFANAEEEARETEAEIKRQYRIILAERAPPPPVPEAPVVPAVPMPTNEDKARIRAKAEENVAATFRSRYRRADKVAQEKAEAIESEYQRLLEEEFPGGPQRMKKGSEIAVIRTRPSAPIPVREGMTQDELNTGLMDAIRSVALRSEAIAMQYIQAGANVQLIASDPITYQSETSFSLAYKTKKRQVVEYLIDHASWEFLTTEIPFKKKPQDKKATGHTHIPILAFTQYGDAGGSPWYIPKLIQSGYDVDTLLQSSYGGYETLLFHLASLPRTFAAEKLVVDNSKNFGQCLLAAARGGKDGMEIFEYILTKPLAPGDIYTEDRYWKRPVLNFMIAYRTQAADQITGITQLLNKGLDLNRVSADRTPYVFIAAQTGTKQAIEFILQQPGLNLNVTNKAGETLYEVIVSEKKLTPEIFNKLIESGFDVVNFKPKRLTTIPPLVYLGLVNVDKFKEVVDKIDDLSILQYSWQLTNGTAQQNIAFTLIGSFALQDLQEGRAEQFEKLKQSIQYVLQKKPELANDYRKYDKTDKKYNILDALLHNIKHTECMELLKIFVAAGLDLSKPIGVVNGTEILPLTSILWESSVKRTGLEMAEYVIYILEHGALVTGEYTSHPLWQLCATLYSEKSVDAVRLFIEKGGNVNLAGTKSKNTLLHVASSYGREDLVEYLLSVPGVDITLKNTEGKTALDLAKNQRIRDLFEEAASGPKVMWAGYSKSDIEFYNMVFDNPANVSLCPICLDWAERVDGCMYMTHKCKPDRAHPKLYDMYLNTYGKIEWCTLCGRITDGHHKHYQLSLPTVKADLVNYQVRQAAEHFDKDCINVGGGGHAEKIKRFDAMIRHACELQDEIGKLTERKARSELIEAAWLGAATPSRRYKGILERKKFDIPCEFPEAAAEVTRPDADYPDVPRPADESELKPIKHETPDNTCLVEMDPHEDGRPVYQFQHKQPDGTIWRHEGEYVCGEDLMEIIRAYPMDGLCRINPTKCKGKIYPEELKDIVTPDFYENYRKNFNRENQVRRGGAEGSRVFYPVDLDEALCTPPPKSAGRKKTFRRRKNLRSIKHTRRAF